MYTPLSTSITQLEVETSTTTITISMDSGSYEVRVGKYYFELTEEEIAGVYYAMNKLKTVRKYNNEPQETGND